MSASPIRTAPVYGIEHLEAFAARVKPLIGPVLGSVVPRQPLKMDPALKSDHLKGELVTALEHVLVQPYGATRADDNGVEGNRKTTAIHAPTPLGVEAVMINVGCFTDPYTFRMRKGATPPEAGSQGTFKELGMVLDEDKKAIERFMIAVGLKRKNDGAGVVVATTADVRLIGGWYVKQDRLFRFTHEIVLHTARYGSDEDGFDPGEAKGVPTPRPRK